MSRRTVLLFVAGLCVAANVYLLLRERAHPRTPTGETAESAATSRSESLPAPIVVPAGMLFVPGGEYVVGFDDAEIRAIAKSLNYEVERFIYAYAASPAHKVRMRPYFLGRNEVTNLEYWKFCEETGRRRRPQWWNKNGVFPSGFENRPVVGVTHDDAEAYASWCGCRLPTEEEFEVAARYPSAADQGRPRIFPWGITWPKGKIPCHYNGNVNDKAIRSLKAGHPAVVGVGRFKDSSSALGFNDLAGNAAEWTSSPFVAYPGFKEVRIKQVSFDAREFDASKFTVRGGHFNNTDFCMMGGWRVPNMPDNASDKVGFRVARDVPAETNVASRLAPAQEIDAALSRYPMLAGERRDDLKFPTVGRRAWGVWDEWDDALWAPRRMASLTIAARATDQLIDMAGIRAVARNGPAFLGICRTDVSIVDPPLSPGIYAVVFRIDSANGAGSFLLEPLDALRLPAVAVPGTVVTQSSSLPDSRIQIDAASDEITCVLSLAADAGAMQSLNVTFKLRTEPGVAQKFR